MISSGFPWNLQISFCLCWMIFKADCIQNQFVQGPEPQFSQVFFFSLFGNVICMVYVELIAKFRIPFSWLFVFLQDICANFQYEFEHSNKGHVNHELAAFNCTICLKYLIQCLINLNLGVHPVKVKNPSKSIRFLILKDRFALFKDPRRWPTCSLWPH